MPGQFRQTTFGRYLVTWPEVSPLYGRFDEVRELHIGGLRPGLRFVLIPGHGHDHTVGHHCVTVSNGVHGSALLVVGMERMQAEITITELPDGPLVSIEYSDGHTVRLKCDPDSIVVRLHLGLDATTGDLPRVGQPGLEQPCEADDR